MRLLPILCCLSAGVGCAGATPPPAPPVESRTTSREPPPRDPTPGTVEPDEPHERLAPPSTDDASQRVESPPDTLDELRGTRVLHVGDSFVYAGLAQALRPRFVEVGAHYQVMSRTSSYTTTWAHDAELQRALWSRPDLVLVTLGANEFDNTDPATHAWAVRALVKMLGSVPCVWVAPSSWKKDSGILEVIRANVGTCLYFDTDAIAGPLSRRRDRIHPDAAGGAKWAEALWKWLLEHRVGGGRWRLE